MGFQEEPTDQELFLSHHSGSRMSTRLTPGEGYCGHLEGPVCGFSPAGTVPSTSQGSLEVSARSARVLLKGLRSRS